MKPGGVGTLNSRHFFQVGSTQKITKRSALLLMLECVAIALKAIEHVDVTCRSSR